MNRYKIEFTEGSLKDLKKLDKSIRNMILAYIKKNLGRCENP